MWFFVKVNSTGCFSLKFPNFNPIRGTTYARLSQLIWLYHEGPMHYPFPCTSAYPQASCRLMYTCLFLVCIIHVYFLFLSAGGSLTVQIFGSASPSKSYKDENNSKKLDYPVVSDEHNRLSASPVTVSSRKDRSAK
ncbi:hypothetical protein ACFX13_020912 [Malus domestica]